MKEKDNNISVMYEMSAKCWALRVSYFHSHNIQEIFIIISGSRIKQVSVGKFTPAQNRV